VTVARMFIAIYFLCMLKAFHHSSARGLNGMYIESVFLSNPLHPPPSALSRALKSILSIFSLLFAHPQATPSLAFSSRPPV